MAAETAAAQTDSFDNRFTRQFGVPSERVQKKVLGYLTEDVQAFIRESPFLVLATSDATGRCDASPRGGMPGFVTILDDRHLLLPDIAGNRLFQSYLNVEQNAHVGLLFLIPGSDRTVRVNGTARIATRSEVLTSLGGPAGSAGPALRNPDENAILLQGVVIAVEEAYGHCPRAFKFADLWDTDTIDQNRRALNRP